MLNGVCHSWWYCRVVYSVLADATVHDGCAAVALRQGKARQGKDSACDLPRRYGPVSLDTFIVLLFISAVLFCASTVCLMRSV